MIMGYFLGQKIPNYNIFWEEDRYKDMPDYWKWFHLGYDEGYDDYGQDPDNEAKLAKENEALKALIAANYRVIREEIRKELASNSNIS